MSRVTPRLSATFKLRWSLILYGPPTSRAAQDGTRRTGKRPSVRPGRADETLVVAEADQRPVVQRQAHADARVVDIAHLHIPERLFRAAHQRKAHIVAREVVQVTHVAIGIGILCLRGQ